MSSFSSLFYIFWALLVFAGPGEVHAGYKIRLLVLKKCVTPPGREFVGSGVEYHMSARKVSRDTTLVRTNFTIARRTGPFSITFRCYQLQQNSVRDLVFQVEKLSCSSPLTYQLVMALNVTLTKDCYALPGTYTADKINIDDFKWLLTKAMIGPGRYAYELEFVAERGVVACIDIACDISVVK